jgi:hypothetical protein
MTGRPWLAWTARATWVSLAFTAGALLADALSGHSRAVRLVAAVVLWGAWATVVVALLVPRPAGLVAFRVGALSAFGAACWAALDGGAGAGGALLALLSALPLGVALLPETGAWLVNGPAYGDERRHLLRLPASLALGPVALAALLVPIAVLAGPLLVAARQWLLGLIALAVGFPAAVALGRALHALTMRWLVIVPAGVVIKDHLAFGDAVLFRRNGIASLAPAAADTDAIDLTSGAFGLALELRLREPVEVPRVTGRAESALVTLDALLVTPTRPGAVLADAGTRRLTPSG